MPWVKHEDEHGGADPYARFFRTDPGAERAEACGAMPLCWLLVLVIPAVCPGAALARHRGGIAQVLSVATRCYSAKWCTKPGSLCPSGGWQCLSLRLMHLSASPIWKPSVASGDGDHSNVLPSRSRWQHG